MSDAKQSLRRRLFGPKTARPDTPPTQEAIQTWLIDKVATHIEAAPEEIDIQEPFSNYGLSSRTAVGLAGELERWLGRRLSPTLVWDFPTIELMAKHLAADPEQAVRGAADGSHPDSAPTAPPSER